MKKKIAFRMMPSAFTRLGHRRRCINLKIADTKISAILFLCLLTTACMQTQSFHRTNGWYYVTSQTADSLSQTPFLTVKDFDTLRLETDAFGQSVITGAVLQDKLPIWREATTKSVGKCIAFVFNDTVITAPQVNIPLESGHFQISNPHGYDLERIFKELQKEIKGN